MTVVMIIRYEYSRPEVTPSALTNLRAVSNSPNVINSILTVHWVQHSLVCLREMQNNTPLAFFFVWLPSIYPCSICWRPSQQRQNRICSVQWCHHYIELMCTPHTKDFLILNLHWSNTMLKMWGLRCTHCEDASRCTSCITAVCILGFLAIEELFQVDIYWKMHWGEGGKTERREKMINHPFANKTIKWIWETFKSTCIALPTMGMGERNLEAVGVSGHMHVYMQWRI